MGTETDEMDNPYVDDFGTHVGFCNSCGEEAEIDTECCEDGEVEMYADDPENQ